ncbi:hypothetical protein [Jiangella asiatica]|uniref:LmrA/YxaF family transcription factor n=1 Tax=Jiangella asiatica TaxID=2530372 RepID=UPI003B83148C
MGAHSQRLRAACAAAFESWVAPLAEHLVAGDTRRKQHGRWRRSRRARSRGAVILSRARRSGAGPPGSAGDDVAQQVGPGEDAHRLAVVDHQ